MRSLIVKAVMAAFIISTPLASAYAGGHGGDKGHDHGHDHGHHDHFHGPVPGATNGRDDGAFNYSTYPIGGVPAGACIYAGGSLVRPGTAVPCHAATAGPLENYFGGRR